MRFCNTCHLCVRFIPRASNRPHPFLFFMPRKSQPSARQPPSVRPSLPARRHSICRADTLRRQPTKLRLSALHFGAALFWGPPILLRFVAPLLRSAPHRYKSCSKSLHRAKQARERKRSLARVRHLSHPQFVRVKQTHSSPAWRIPSTHPCPAKFRQTCVFSQAKHHRCSHGRKRPCKTHDKNQPQGCKKKEIVL